MIASVLFLNNVSPAVKQLKHHATPPAFIGITKKYVVRTIKVAALEPLSSVIRRARSFYALGMWISIYFILAIQMSGVRSQPHAPPLVRVFCLFFPTRSPSVRRGCKYIWVQIESASAKVWHLPASLHYAWDERARCCAHLNAKATSSAEVFLNMSPAQYFSRLHFCPRRVQ